MKNTCGKCIHYVQVGTTRHGECYLLPPTPHPGGFSSRPIVGYSSQGCAGFEPAEAKAAEEPTLQEIKSSAPALVASAIANGSAVVTAQASPKYAPRFKTHHLIRHRKAAEA